MVTRVTATFHPSSSVLSSFKCQLLSRDLEHLVVAKLNSVEVYSIQPDKLRHECSLEIRGKVRSVKAIPFADSHRSNILVLLDHPDPELLFLTYTETEAGSGKLEKIVQEIIQLDERGSRPSEFFTDVLVHPSGKFAVVSVYAGRLKVVTLSDGSYYAHSDVQLPELNILSLAFLPDLSEDHYALGILHVDHQENTVLVARDLTLEDDSAPELSNQVSLRLLPTSIAPKDVPYPEDTHPQIVTFPSDNDNNFLGGILVVGGRRILLYECSTVEEQDTHKGKRKRLDGKKKNRDEKTRNEAKEKEDERMTKKRKARASVEWPWSQVLVCSSIGSKFFIGDSFGRLALLSLIFTNEEAELIIVPLGETSPPTTITYLTNQALFIGSHLGDSQVVQISPRPLSHPDTPTLPIPPEIRSISSDAFDSADSGGTKGKGRAAGNFGDEELVQGKGRVIRTHGRYLSVLQSFTNIAPIHDGALVDLDGSGPHQIITCSGGGNTGSINLVRSGADFEESASVELRDVVGIWPLRDRLRDKSHTLLVASTLQTTHIFRLESNNTLPVLPNSNNTGFITDEPTLFVQNIAEKVDKEYRDGSMIVQVTPKAIRLLQPDEVMNEVTKIDQVDAGTVGAKYGGNNSNTRIVAASVNNSQILAALGHGILASYKVVGGKLERVIANPLDYGTGSEGSTDPIKRRPWFKSEISAVSCTPLNPSKNYAQHVAVAFWHTNQIKIYKLTEVGFAVVAQSPCLPALVRSVMFYNFGTEVDKPLERDYHAYMVAGLADGSLVTLAWVDGEMKDMKVVSLGKYPVSLAPHEIGGRRTIIATGSRSVMVSWEKSRLQYSPVNLKDIVSVQSFNSTHYPSSVILTTPSRVFIGRVKDLGKMHIRSTPLGLDCPRRIAHDPTMKVFGVNCIRTEPVRVGNDPLETSVFRVLDETTFQELAQFTCDTDEQAMSLTLLKYSEDGQPRTFFCVGTVYLRNDEREPKEGRILVFSVFQVSPTNTQLSLVVDEKINGCVYSLVAMSNGTLAAAVNSSVMLFRMGGNEMESFSLQRIVDWNHNYVVMSMAECRNHLVVADQFSSVSLLQTNESGLKTVARDYSPLWPLCVENFNEKKIIGAEHSLNMFTFSTKTVSNRVVLEKDGFYNVGDVVTKFIRGSLVSLDKTSTFKPTHVFLTLSGRIGVVVDVKNNARGDNVAETLTQLQTQMGQTDGAFEAVGNVSHARHRAPRNTKGRSDADESSFGILDGDFLEQYLGLVENSPQVAENIAAAAALDRTVIQGALETLQSMH
ncbi:hypothetical protein D9758_007154 [Tetrapyrgos nigripes]|uniref:DNA damage-binding protein 1 n=1 Tax=Tetrapyrgos nigripes TaxID=182062 RepID=A0A8H5LMP7_9AGAR|nr:hypothetical protein D9758_007154 [Tetrapyrgos nigripes]